MSSDLGIKRPSASALGEMFARVRDRLGEQAGGVPIYGLSEVLALTIYLTWQTEAEAPDSGALTVLRVRVEEALHG